MGNSSIHIKLEYPEAISIKRNILLTEKELLETSKHIKNYNSLRQKEFVLKNRIKKDFGILIELISTLESHLPKEEAEIMTKKTPKEIIKTQERIHKQESRVIESKKSNIEKQIDEIREKLAMLGEGS